MPADTETIAFALHLRPGAAAEYQRRHDAIWPELVALQRAAGILRYEIFLHAPSHLLFAHIERRRDHGMEDFPRSEIWRRWQAHMAGLIEQRDGVPVRDAMPCVFRMPAG
ncbi:MAG: L-rhamnose mutarotase [Planctomycetes bacterium]|jgi:L-rhamnose mutarotase|nr:L-rhamnose mutarotase [Alphaproteobacteria bacterium]MBM3963333.1 L-rhamnose mutarotase [Planctomycetota bacterium]